MSTIFQILVAVYLVQISSEVHDLHVWSLTSGLNTISAHAVIIDQDMHDRVLNEVQKRVTSQFTIAHVTLQVECRDYAAHETHL